MTRIEPVPSLARHIRCHSIQLNRKSQVRLPNLPASRKAAGRPPIPRVPLSHTFRESPRPTRPRTVRGPACEPPRDRASAYRSGRTRPRRAPRRSPSVKALARGFQRPAERKIGCSVGRDSLVRHDEGFGRVSTARVSLESVDLPGICFHFSLVLCRLAPLKGWFVGDFHLPGRPKRPARL